MKLGVDSPHRVRSNPAFAQETTSPTTQCTKAGWAGCPEGGRKLTPSRCCAGRFHRGRSVEKSPKGGRPFLGRFTTEREKGEGRKERRSRDRKKAQTNRTDDNTLTTRAHCDHTGHNTREIGIVKRRSRPITISAQERQPYKPQARRLARVRSVDTGGT